MKRAILVVDRGWIFAGDVMRLNSGHIRLKNAVHVFRWERIGFAAMVREWRSSNVDLRRIDDVEVPADAILFRVPVAAGWGLK